MKRCIQLLSLQGVLGAAVPKNYSNVPYKRDDEADVVKRQPTRPSGESRRNEPMMSLAPCLAAAAAPSVPSPMRSSFIDRSTIVDTHFNRNEQIKSFRRAVCRTTDVSMRPMLFLHAEDAADVAAGVSPATVAQRRQREQRGPANSFGEGRLEDVSCRWAAKFYGKVTFGPRNYPYPSSRWLARRYKMKKHRIIKRFRFRRYKLAAVANLPFAKMIRVGMLPELKTSKTKKGDSVDAGLSSQLVNAARASSAGAKETGKRSRPRSKYQV